MKYLLMLVALVAVSITSVSCNVNKFEGIREISDEEIYLDFILLSQSEIQEFDLKDGQVIAIEIEVLDGELDVLLTDNKGNNVYQGDAVTTSSFNVTVGVESTYTLTVTGKKACGNFRCTFL